MSEFDVKQLGHELYSCLLNRNTVAPLSSRFPRMTIDDAYQVQQHLVARRVSAGETIVGKKIGVTSKAVQDMIGIDQPDFGQLTSGMAYREGENVSLSALIQPRVEAEIAFVLKRDLKGPGITATDVISAIDYAVPCFEIVDSRITDWKIAIQDTVADNASCGVYLLGNARAKMTEVDFNLAGMVVERNGELFSTAAGASVQGGPINAVVWLANTLGRLGIPFLAGEVILSGSQSALIPVVAGDSLRCTVGGLGSCEINFTE
jgi:2-oxopent-4-enoate/cis-2-oxohex-4-enoate hydratase